MRATAGIRGRRWRGAAAALLEREKARKKLIRNY